MLSAAVMIGALRVKFQNLKNWLIFFLISKYLLQISAGPIREMFFPETSK